jgi:Tfp pilus assembly protein PilV
VSLLEVLAAMALFALVASGVGALATQSMVRTGQNRHATAAALLAQRELERIRALPYASVAAAGGSTSATIAGQSFTVSSVVQPDTPALNMSQITTTVSWTGPEGAKSYAVRTIFTSVTS